MKRCINEDCRAELADSAEFCPDCNTKQPIASGVNVCRNCGAALAVDAKFCQKCGTPVGEEVSPTTPVYDPKDIISISEVAFSILARAKDNWETIIGTASQRVKVMVTNNDKPAEEFGWHTRAKSDTGEWKVESHGFFSWYRLLGPCSKIPGAKNEYKERGIAGNEEQMQRYLEAIIAIGRDK